MKRIGINGFSCEISVFLRARPMRFFLLINHSSRSAISAISSSSWIAAFIVICVSGSAMAHGGRLNREGCHNDNARGSYHCHRKANRSPQKQLAPSQNKSSDTLNEEKRGYIPYSRELYAYESYLSKTSIGFYTGKNCTTNIDHVVSLKDAHESGAFAWEPKTKGAFANDKFNHVPACSRINSSKGSSAPRDFLRKSADGKGMEYEIRSFCGYVGIYYQVKKKYDLSFRNNDPRTFNLCGITLK